MCPQKSAECRVCTISIVAVVENRNYVYGYAYRYAAVGNIERRPAVVYNRQMHVDEIYNVPETHTVNQIADDPARKNAERNAPPKVGKPQAAAEKPKGESISVARPPV